jgi:succinate-semialdehyde dehydrogenase / glutarate-semialdehyde dehydrogenase
MVKSINPFDQSVVEQYEEFSLTRVQEKLQRSSAAFKDWRKTSFARRGELMRNVSRLLKQNKEQYARMITLEMGKVLSESRAEVEKSADGCLYFSENAEKLLADQTIKTDSRKSLVSFHPTGTILAVMPWNFPFWQVIRFAAPALMAGNVGVLKHASNVSGCSLLLEKIFREAGFPEGVFQSLIIDNRQIESILQSDIVQGVALTGSELAGSNVASIAGKYIKKSVLELGGSDPFIVLADADLELAAKIATQSRMQNAGQSCISAKRFIVDKRVKDEFTNRFLENIKALKQGDPFLETTTTGPLARVDLADTLEKQLNNSIEQGAKLLAGGRGEGANFKPALLDQVKPGMQAFDEETFGPLAAIITVSSEEEAIDVANSSRYGLGSSVWTRDLERGEKVARQVESGSVFINALMKSDARMPFGGIKKSGYGRELSEHGIKEFVNVKAISVS